MPLIEAVSLTKSYRGVPAIDSLSFSYPPGGIYGIIGHNGAGKTTLLKCICGLITPTSGTVRVNGIDVTTDAGAVKGVLGYLPEESRLYETMTAWDYLAFFGECYGIDRKTVRERSVQLMGDLALDPGTKRLGEFSKGMKRKVALARSLIHDPGILVYDEATSGLDPMTSRYIMEFLRRLKDNGKTVVMSAHNLYQVEALCTRVMILRRGRVIAEGTMPELREQFGSVRYSVHFSLPTGTGPDVIGDAVLDDGGYVVDAKDISTLNRVTESVSSAGGEVARITSHYPSLEEMLVQIEGQVTPS